MLKWLFGDFFSRRPGPVSEHPYEFNSYAVRLKWDGKTLVDMPLLSLVDHGSNGVWDSITIGQDENSPKWELSVVKRS